jgi:hypothetical protein
MITTVQEKRVSTKNVVHIFLKRNEFKPHSSRTFENGAENWASSSDDEEALRNRDFSH